MLAGRILRAPTKTPRSGCSRSEATDTERVGPPEVLADGSVPSPPEKGKGSVNVLPDEKRVRVLAALLDGNSERAVERMTDVNRRTISRLVLALGAGAERLHDRLVRDLRTPLVQVDEVWGYVAKKNARVTENDAPGIGEAYTFVGMDTLSRLVIAWRVGRRDQETCDAFISDLRARLLVMPQLTSDGFPAYIPSVAASFGGSIDYMQTVKNCRTGSKRGPDHTYEPPRDPFITKRTVFGAPDARPASRPRNSSRAPATTSPCSRRTTASAACCATVSPTSRWRSR